MGGHSQEGAMSALAPALTAPHHSPLPQQLLHIFAHLPSVQQPLQQHFVARVRREVSALVHGTVGRSEGPQ